MLRFLPEQADFNGNENVSDADAVARLWYALFQRICLFWDFFAVSAKVCVTRSGRSMVFLDCSILFPEVFCRQVSEKPAGIYDLISEKTLLHPGSSIFSVAERKYFVRHPGNICRKHLRPSVRCRPFRGLLRKAYCGGYHLLRRQRLRQPSAFHR